MKKVLGSSAAALLGGIIAREESPHLKPDVVTATTDVPLEEQLEALVNEHLDSVAKNITGAKAAELMGIPDRVSIEPGPHYWPGYKKLGVKIDGEIRRADVVEFCVSQGWAMVHVKDKYGRKQADPSRPGFLLNTRVEGVIEPYWIDRDQKKAEPGDAARLAAAEAKRQRKAAKLAAIHG